MAVLCQETAAGSFVVTSSAHVVPGTVLPVALWLNTAGEAASLRQRRVVDILQGMRGLARGQRVLGMSAFSFQKQAGLARGGT